MLERLRKFLSRSMTNQEISYKAAKQLMQKDKNAILLDVRSKQEYEEGHLPGSTFLCLYDIEKKAESVLPNKTQTIITYCASGSRSKEAQEILESMGYEQVYNLKGGLEKIK